jgi:small ligand-binding sensory domain FIST
MVLRVGGDTALDLLSSYAPGVQDVQNAQQNNIVLVALDVSAEAGSLEPIVVVRPVRGVDPGRRGVLVGSEVRAGMRMTFAVCDATVARAALEAVARTLAQHALGAAPRFALYLASARMGQNLHGAADVETRILRQRFGDLPTAGMRSPFEVFPGARGGVCVTEYAGVLSLFRSPS